MYRRTLTAAVIALAALGGHAAETALDRYVAKPDPNYAYTHVGTEQGVGYTTYILDMTSQQWRSTAEVDRAVWQHQVVIAVPWGARLAGTHTALLYIDGGSNGSSLPDEFDELIGLVALLTELPVAAVRQVPNQPLYFTDENARRRTEDEILAYSLDKFLVTGDEEWPVHLAMTKATVRAMDTVETFLLGQALRVDDFIVMGGSKRGWTTWLTAAVDPRVKGIVPTSIDVLNIVPQITRHWEAYGFYSPAIADYAEFDIFCRSQGAEGEALMDIVDPYRYRGRYNMPKLLMNSAGDMFFLPDSSRLYYRDLPGPKRLRYGFNTDHPNITPSILLGAISWIRTVAGGGTPPRYDWIVLPGGLIVVLAFDPPREVKLWHATNPDARDFRRETIGFAWRRRALRPFGNGLYLGYMPPPDKGWTAFSVELTFDGGDAGADHVFTTDVVVVPDLLPYAGTHCTN